MELDQWSAPPKLMKNTKYQNINGIKESARWEANVGEDRIRLSSTIFVYETIKDPIYPPVLGELGRNP